MKLTQQRMVSLLAVAVAIGCGGRPEQASAKDAQKPIVMAAATADAPPAAAGSASVNGSVKFTGTAPTPERVKMDADPQCAMQHKDPVTKQDVVVNPNGTLKSVFVYVKEGAQPTAAPKTPVQLTQHGCMYEPHVLGIQVNQPFEIINSDATLHNVNCKPTKSKPFNIAQPTQGMKSSKQFTAPEVMVPCKCNVHPWMASYIGVLDHPYYAVTGDDGSFAIKGLPAGQYTLEAWHEKYGTSTKTVTVADGESKQVDFEFK